MAILTNLRRKMPTLLLGCQITIHLCPKSLNVLDFFRFVLMKIKLEKSFKHAFLCIVTRNIKIIFHTKFQQSHRKNSDRNEIPITYVKIE